MSAQKKVAIITGANQGLGKELTGGFLGAGYHVFALARDGQLLQQMAAEYANLIASKGVKLMTRSVDVTDVKNVDAVVNEAALDLGRVDVLVNNAGIYGPKGWTEQVDLEEWRRTIDVNLMGTLIPIRSVVPIFKKAKSGRIINLSGGGATNPMPMISAYAASKAAVVRLTETLALELKDFNITVNAVAPGALNTRLLDEVLSAGPDKVGAEFYRKSLEQKEKGGSNMEHAVALSLFLASEHGAGVTGRLISAIWDNWQTLPERAAEVGKSDIYTLRRITSKDRGFNWDK